MPNSVPQLGHTYQGPSCNKHDARLAIQAVLLGLADQLRQLDLPIPKEIINGHRIHMDTKAAIKALRDYIITMAAKNSQQS